jgi:hypothetical protein
MSFEWEWSLEQWEAFSEYMYSLDRLDIITPMEMFNVKYGIKDKMCIVMDETWDVKRE